MFSVTFYIIICINMMHMIKQARLVDFTPNVFHALVVFHCMVYDRWSFHQITQVAIMSFFLNKLIFSSFEHVEAGNCVTNIKGRKIL